MGNSLEVVRAFPPVARQRVGFQLARVQQGLEPQDWKPMPLIGPGVKEIRVHAENEYRIFYVAAFKHSVYVLHSCVKKSRQTSRSDIAIGKARCREVLREEGLKK